MIISFSSIRIFILSISLYLFASLNLNGQSVAINNTGNPADSSAILDLQSTNQGLLVPRLLTIQREQIENPATGLLVYDINLNGYFFYDGTQWLIVKNVFEKTGDLIRVANGDNEEDFVFGTDSLPPDGTMSGLHDFIMFSESDAAFRGGRLFSSNNWSPDSVGFGSFAYGSSPLARGSYSVAFNNSTIARGAHSAAFGDRTNASGAQSVAFGDLSVSKGANSASFGSTSDALGDGAIATGNNTIADGDYAFSHGFRSTASGIYSFAGGNDTDAEGAQSLSFGTGTRSIFNSVAFGRYNIGSGSHVSWVDTDPLFEVGIGTSFGQRENAFGILKDGTISFRNYTFPLNDGTAGQFLTTQGNGQLGWTDGHETVFQEDGTTINQITNVDINDFSFGRNALPDNAPISDYFFFFDQSQGAFRGGGLQASDAWQPSSLGLNSFAFGRNTEASGSYSAALGVNTTAQSLGAVAIGGFNIGGGSPMSWVLTEPVFEIGIGVNNANRANAMTVLKNGEVSFLNYTFPINDGSAGQILGTQGNGTLGWVDQDNSLPGGGMTDQSLFSDGLGGSFWAYSSLSFNDLDNNLSLTPGLTSVNLSALDEWEESGDNIYYNDGDVSVGTSSTFGVLTVGGGSDADAVVWDGGAARLQNSFDVISIDRDFFRILIDADDNQNNAEFAIYHDVSSSNVTPTVKFDLENGDSWYNGGGDFGFNRTDPDHPIHMSSGAHVTSGGVWTNASDMAYKSGIEALQYGLDEVMQLIPRAYQYKKDGSESIGFVAQELEQIIPEVVSGQDGEKGVAYGLLTSVLVNAIQEQQEKIERLEKLVEQLLTEDR